VIYTARSQKPEFEQQVGAVRVDLQQLLTESDILSLHPVTPETKGIINADRLALIKPSAIIINTSRGDLIREGPLAVALEEGDWAAQGSTSTSTSRPSPPICSGRRRRYYSRISLARRRKLAARWQPLPSKCPGCSEGAGPLTPCIDVGRGGECGAARLRPQTIDLMLGEGLRCLVNGQDELVTLLPCDEALMRCHRLL
jgi:hypothetical protein